MSGPNDTFAAPRAPTAAAPFHPAPHAAGRMENSRGLDGCAAPARFDEAKSAGRRDSIAGEPDPVSQLWFNAQRNS